MSDRLAQRHMGNESAGLKIRRDGEKPPAAANSNEPLGAAAGEGNLIGERDVDRVMLLTPIQRLLSCARHGMDLGPSGLGRVLEDFE
ncbi:hypothetical protein ACFFJT_06435 [Dyella flava]|uniref:Uncharacterized protein n=1 Tax=Dyella flava TaxID=1920170 RepID=A0ABS2JZ76_9GAMM|nr:hypothetical protein [Dyella flava]MBM7124085.1 hypothetical protein [Dyella flava]